MEQKAYYHLPGLFEFYHFYKEFLPLFDEHREYFYDWCEIGSIYGAPADCIWGGGRVELGMERPEAVRSLLDSYQLSARLTFSNSLLREQHLSDVQCNRLCKLFQEGNNGIIVHSKLLLDYISQNYPGFYFVSSTTKVLTTVPELLRELNQKEFSYVVPDFRLNKQWEQLKSLSEEQKNKLEFLCNECCDFHCQDRRACYEAVSRKNLGISGSEHKCTGRHATQGYRFSKAMENPGFLSVEEIQKLYMPMGFSNFKIEGRGLGSALLLEFILYYMTKPQYAIHVREALYLENTLDLF